MRTLLAALLLGSIAQAEEPLPLALRARIALAGVEGRIDHLSADVKGQRLFVAALGNRSVEVLDVKAGKRLHSIPGLAEPQGLSYDPSTTRLFVACAGDGTAKVFDGATFRLLGTTKLGDDADNIRHDARQSRIIVGYGDGALGFLDANGNQTGRIPLDAHPESFQLEKTGTRVFVNVPDRKQIQVADLARMSAVAKWPVTSALKNYPMSLDEDRHRLFIGCRAPARLLVIDTETGRQTASFDIAGDTDDLFYDAAERRVYVICGQGSIDVFRQADADRYDRVARLATSPGARTGLFVAEWRKLFVAVPRRGDRPAEVLVYDTLQD